MSRARCLITVLNSWLPVKYNIVNAYSFGCEYSKSIRLANLFSVDEPVGSRPIVKLLTFPLDNNSMIIPSFTSRSKNSVNISLLFSLFVIIRSISPDVSAFLR